MHRSMMATVTAIALLTQAVPAASQTGEGAPSNPEGGLEVGRFTLTAERVERSDGALLMSDILVDAKNRDGRIRIDRLGVTDDRIVAAVLGGGRTDAGCLPEGSAVASEFELEGLRFLPDEDAAVGAIPTGEEIRIRRSAGILKMSDCDVSLEATVDGVTVSGVGGETLTVPASDVTLEMSGPDGRRIDARLDAAGLALGSNGIPLGAEIGDWGLSFRGDLSETGLVPRLTEGLGLEDALLAARGADLRAGLYARDMDMDIARFLPERERARLGLTGIDRLTGDLEFASLLSSGTARITLSGGIDQLATGTSAVSVGLPGKGGLTLPDMISDRLPVPEILMGVTIETLQMSYVDHGLNVVAEDVTGSTPGTAFANAANLALENVSDKAPEGAISVLKQARDAIVTMLEQDGRVALEPDAPVSLMNVAMKALVSPSGVAGQLGATASDVENGDI